MSDIGELWKPRPTILSLYPAPSINNTGKGLVVVDNVGENISPGEVLYLANDGLYYKADADSANTMPAKVLAMESIAANNAGKLLHIGYYRHDAWTWVLGNGEANLLFVDTTSGGMVQLAGKPAGSGDQVQVVGYVVTADIIFFNPSLELVEVA